MHTFIILSLVMLPPKKCIALWSWPALPHGRKARPRFRVWTFGFRFSLRSCWALHGRGNAPGGALRDATFIVRSLFRDVSQQQLVVGATKILAATDTPCLETIRMHAHPKKNDAGGPHTIIEVGHEAHGVEIRA